MVEAGLIRVNVVYGTIEVYFLSPCIHHRQHETLETQL